MDKYINIINKGDRLNLWKYDNFNIERYLSDSVAFDNKDYFYDIGISATNMEQISEIIYPVREKFLQENILENVNYEKREYSNIYFPWENTRVEFSGFNHYPAIRSLNFQSYIEVEEDGIYEFELKITGGIKIWINGELQVSLEKYKRNCGVLEYIKLEFKKGENEIVIYTNDLAERDIYYFFEIKYIGENKLEHYIYINNPDKVKNTIETLKMFYFISDETTPEDCKLGFNKEFIKTGFKFSVNAEGIDKVLEYTVEEKDLNNGYILLDNYFDEKTLGGRKVKIIHNVEGIDLERELYILVYAKENENIVPKDTIIERKKQAIEYLYKYKSEVVPRLIPTLEKGFKLDDDERKFAFGMLEAIDKRLDCSDFKLPIFLLIKEKYGHLLDKDIIDEIKRVSLNYRYWIDEAGSDVMWFFSENHAFLFHICQYLTGEIYENETFISGYSSEEQRKLGYDRLVKWFEEFLAVGYDEWNSTTYLPVDFIGFFVLLEIAKDNKIKDFAKKALDISFEIIASNVHRNIYATSYGRTYEKQLKSAKLAELSMISWIAFGYGSTNNRDHATALFAISNYEPNSFDELLNTDKNSITIERLQGRNKVYTYINKCKEYALASVIRFNPFLDGMQQHIMNIILGDEDKSIISWINHPGERIFSGEHRPSYWAGNGCLPLVEQYKNLCILSFKIDEEKDVHYIHSYMPINKLCEYEVSGKWFFGRVNNSYIGLYFENGIEITTQGANTNKEIISYGLENYVIVRCGSERENNSFSNFKKNLLNTELIITDVNNFTYKDFEHGKIEIIHNSNLVVDGNLISREAKKEGIVSFS